MKNQFIAHQRKSDGTSQSLWRHLAEVSELAGKFSAKIGLPKQGELLGILHDLGKASSEFDSYIKSAVGLIDSDDDSFVNESEKKGKIDHSSAGAQILYKKLTKQGSEGEISAQVLALCIASHHSGMIDCLSPDGLNNFARRIKKPEEKAHTNESYANINDLERETIEHYFTKELTTQILVKIRSLKEENDSIETVMFKAGLLTRFFFSCLIDADRLNTADFEFPQNTRIRNSGNYTPWEILIQRFATKKFDRKNKVDDLREEISRQCFEFANRPKGLYQLTVPTGGGKTFSSLRFALNHAASHGMERIIYVIPYTSIIDQNADEVKKVLEEKDGNGNYLDTVVLEHHSNLSPEEETYRQSLLAENWDAPVVFTTSVQLLEALFGSGTKRVRRMHQLANAVIIFDEIQTIPIRCVHMFNVAIRFLINACGSTVVLCTATQPLLDKIECKSRALVISPQQKMIKDVTRLFRDLKRVEIHDVRKPGGWTEIEVRDIARRELQEAGSVLIVVNTKKSARGLYDQLKGSDLKGGFHLSTDMCPQHRLDVLETIKDRLEKNLPTICVSTQLIEAGVDIDFGSVIRYLAGLDSIAQAAGRCNRHGLRKRGNVFVVDPRDESLGNLEEIRIAAETAQRVLDEFKASPARFGNDLLSPAAMEQFYTYYFYDRKDKMDYPVTSTSSVGREDDLFTLLSTNSKSVEAFRRINNGQQPSLFLKQSFQTAAQCFRAIDSSTIGVIVPYGAEGKQIIADLCAAFEVEKQYKLLKQAQRYSVNVYEGVFKNLAENGIINEVQNGTGVFFLDSQYYSNEFGLSREIVSEMETLITEG